MAGTLKLQFSALEGLPSSLPHGTPLEVSVGSTTVAFDSNLGAELNLPWWLGDGNSSNIAHNNLPQLEFIVTGTLAFGVSSLRQRSRTVELGRGTLDVSRILEGHLSLEASTNIPIDVSLRVRNSSSALALMGTVAWVPALESPSSGLSAVVLHVVAAVDLVLNFESGGTFGTFGGATSAMSSTIPQEAHACYVQATFEPLIPDAVIPATAGTTAAGSFNTFGQLYHWLIPYKTSVAVAEPMGATHSKPNQVFDCGVGQLFVAQPLRRVTWHSAFTCVDVAWAGDIETADDGKSDEVNDERGEIVAARKANTRRRVESTGRAWAGGLELRLVVMDANTHAQLAFASCPLETLLTENSKIIAEESTQQSQDGHWLPLTRYPDRSGGFDCGDGDNDCVGSILVDAVPGGRLEDAQPEPTTAPGDRVGGLTEAANTSNHKNPEDLLIEVKQWPSPSSVAIDVLSDIFDSKCSESSPKGPAGAHSEALCTVVEKSERELNAKYLSPNSIRNPLPDPHSMCGQLFTKFASMPGGGYGGKSIGSISCSNHMPEPWMSLQGLQKLCEEALPRIVSLDLPRWYFRARVAGATTTEEGAGRLEEDVKVDVGGALNAQPVSQSNSSANSDGLDDWAKGAIRAAARRFGRAAAIGSRELPPVMSSIKNDVGGILVDVVRSDDVLVVSRQQEDTMGIPHSSPSYAKVGSSNDLQGKTMGKENNPNLNNGGTVGLVQLSTVRHDPIHGADEDAVRSIEQLLTASRCISAHHHCNDAADDNGTGGAPVGLRQKTEAPPSTVAALRITWPLFQAWWTKGIPPAASMIAQQDRAARALTSVEMTFRVLDGGENYSSSSSSSSPSANSRSRLHRSYISSSSDSPSGLLGEVQSLLGEAKAMDRGSARRALVDTCQSAGRDACRLAWQAAAEMPTSAGKAMPLDLKSEADILDTLLSTPDAALSSTGALPTHDPVLSTQCNELAKTLRIATDSLAAALDRLESNAAQALAAASAIAHETSSPSTKNGHDTSVGLAASEQIDAVSPAGSAPSCTVEIDGAPTTAPLPADISPVNKPSRPRSARLRAGAASRAQTELVRDEACCADAASQLDTTVAALLAELLAAVANETCFGGANRSGSNPGQRSPVDPRERLSQRRRERSQAAATVALEARHSCVLFGTSIEDTTYDRGDAVSRGAPTSASGNSLAIGSLHESREIPGDGLAQSEGALAAVAVLRTASQRCAALCKRSSRLQRGRLAAFRRLKEGVEVDGESKATVADEKIRPFIDSESDDMGALLKRLEHAYPPPAVLGETLQRAPETSIGGQSTTSLHGSYPANTSVGTNSGSSRIAISPTPSVPTTKKSRVPAALWVILSDNRPSNNDGNTGSIDDGSRYTEATRSLTAAAERRLQAIAAEYERGGSQGPLTGCLCKALGPSPAHALRRGCEAVLAATCSGSSYVDNSGSNGSKECGTPRGMIAVVNALFPTNLPPGTASTACALEPWVAGMDALPELHLRPIDAFTLRSFVLAARADAIASGKSHEMPSDLQEKSDDPATDESTTVPLPCGVSSRKRRYLAPRAALPAALLIVAFVLNGTAISSRSDEDEEADSNVGGATRLQRWRKRRQREKEQMLQSGGGYSNYHEESGTSVPKVILEALDKYWEAADEVAAPTAGRGGSLEACCGIVVTHSVGCCGDSSVQREWIELQPGDDKESAEGENGTPGTEVKEAGMFEADGETSNAVIEADNGTSFKPDTISLESSSVDKTPQEHYSLASEGTGVDDDEALQRGLLPHIPEGNEGIEEDGDSQVEVNSTGRSVTPLTSEVPGSEATL